MPRILSIDTKDTRREKASEQNPFGLTWRWISSLDKFTKLFLITIALVSIVTPSIVTTYLIFTSKASNTEQSELLAYRQDQGCMVDKIPTIEELSNNAGSIIHGKVREIKSYDNGRGQINSILTYTTQEAFKKKPQTEELSILGGQVNNIVQVVGCHPKFENNEEFLAFLEEDSKNPGKFQIKSGFLAKFKIKGNHASRGIGGENPIELTELQSKIKKSAGEPLSLGINLNKIYSFFDPLIQAKAYSIYNPPMRRFPQEIPVKVDMDNDPFPGLGNASYEAVRNAINAWNGSGAQFSYTAGSIVDVNYWANDGENLVIFHDNAGIIPSCCYASTAITYDPGQIMTVNSTSLSRILDADVIIDHTRHSWNQTQLTEIIGHELGHGLGLGHATNNSGALMDFYRNVDTGATLTPDDINGIKFLYPILNQPPIGAHDGVDNSVCRTWGWASDPDTSSTSISVDIYRDDPAGGGGTGIGRYTANVSREAAVGNHGFNITFNSSSGLFNGASHTLYAYAIDSAGGNNPLLGGSPKTITCPIPTPTPSSSITISHNPCLIISGASCTSTVNWSTSGYPSAYICTLDGSTETFFSSGKSGSKQITLPTSKTYQFIMRTPASNTCGSGTIIKNTSVLSSTGGDVDCNGVINSVDSLQIQRFVVGLPISNTKCPKGSNTIDTTQADVNKNGRVDTVDSLFILKYVSS